MKASLAAMAALMLTACAHGPGRDAGTTSVTTLNGTVPPGVLARSIKQEQLLAAPDGRGQQRVVARTTRAAGTRTPIHRHDHGGFTCVLQGEMTLYLEGAAPQRAVAGQCYDMPAARMMAGVNTGAITAVMLDVFVLPVGASVWTVVEQGAADLQDQFTRHH